MSANDTKVGILAYGSLIDEPGDEIAAVTSEVIRDVMTPFPIEFARSSTSRGGAPTLVPHCAGRSTRAAVISINCGAAEARNMLWRRETRKFDRALSYPGTRRGLPNAVNVMTIASCGFDVLLYTSIAGNIDPLDAPTLAELSIGSLSKVGPGLDGISYLISARENGIVTALSNAYEAEILNRTGAKNLAEARETLLREI